MTNTKREIKFRAWDKQLNIITDVVCLNLGTWNDVILIHPDSKIVHRQETYNQKTENIELMQFTGLRDRLGKEIYEGYVVKVGSKKWFDKGYTTNEEVTIGIDGVSFGNKKPFAKIYAGEVSGQEANYYDTFQIIGNIYENPELTKKD